METCTAADALLLAEPTCYAQVDVHVARCLYFVAELYHAAIALDARCGGTVPSFGDTAVYRTFGIALEFMLPGYACVKLIVFVHTAGKKLHQSGISFPFGDGDFYHFHRLLYSQL